MEPQSNEIIPVNKPIDEFEETIDDDFITQSAEPTLSIDQNIYKTKLNTNDLYIIIYNDGRNGVNDILASIISISTDDKKIYLKDEENNTSFISFINDDELLLKTDDYHILEIQKVKELNIDTLNNDDFILTKDLYPEIYLDVDPVKHKQYSIQEKKESLITEMIAIYNAYNNDTLIQQIYDIADNFIKIYQKDIIDDYSNKLQFIKELLHHNNFNLPSWIIPIVDNKKIIYKQDDEDKTPHDDIIIKDFIDELKEKYEILSQEGISSNSYKRYLNILENYTPFKNNNHLLIPYDGLYFRNCNQLSPCNGLKNDIIMDINKTRKTLKVPFSKNYVTNFETLYPNEMVSIIGFYTLPYNHLDIFFKNNDTLNLSELYYLSHFKYSYKTLKDRIDLSKTIPHTMSNSTEKTFEMTNNDGKYIHSFLFSEKINNDDLGNILQNNFFNYSDIINSVPDTIKNNIYNHDDFNKVFLSYQINYRQLDRSNKELINELIQTNINTYVKNYNQSVKRKIIKIIPTKITPLTIEEKISHSLQYIMSIHIIPLKNDLLKRFIKSFARNPIHPENNNYLYQKNSKKKLLCKHHLYSIETHKNKEMYNSLKTIYGSEPCDGNISCKICGSYLFPEDFSLLEGFSDGVPTNTKEILETDDDTKLLNEKQLKIKKRIKKISNIIGLELNKYDTQHIIDFFGTIDDETIINHRYGSLNSFQNHPDIPELKKKYKIIPSPKSPQDKKKNQKNKSLLKENLSKLKQYMVDANELLIIMFLILFHLQTSIPPYVFNTRVNLQLWDNIDKPWDTIKNDIQDMISMNTIEATILIIKKLISIHKKDPFWKNIQKLLNESVLHTSCPNFKMNFLKISSFILKNQKIFSKLKNYYLIKNNINQVFLKENWPSYKPMNDNKLVVNINSKINNEHDDIYKYLLKNGSNISYSNISSIQSINKSSVTPRFMLLNIPYSEIMKNESFERLFDFSIHLHGRTKNIPLIDLLINRFLNTISNPTISSIISKLKWNTDTKKLNSIDYNDFKKIFIIEITQHYKNKNKEDEDNINTFIHLHINNWNGMLLNGHSKRNYIFSQPIIYPTENYNQLISNKSPIITKLFRKYCIKNDILRQNFSSDYFIYNLLAHPDVNKTITCSDSLVKNNNNFNRILKYHRDTNKLLFIGQHINDTTKLFENRIHEFIQINNLLSNPSDDSYDIFNQLNNIHSIDNIDLKKKEYSKIFNLMFIQINNHIQKINDFFSDAKSNDLLSTKQINRFKSSFGRNINNIDVLLNKLIDNKNTPNMIFQIYHIISQLSNFPIHKGTTFDSNIPKYWKLSDTNTKHLEQFLEKNIFLQHLDIYIPDSHQKEEGFYKYKKEKNHHLYFRNLLHFLKKFYTSGLDLLQGDNHSLFTEEYSEIFNQFIFIYLFNKIIEYIDMLKDETSNVSIQANEIFSSLEEQYQLNLNDNILQCSQFSFDLLSHFFEEYIDTSWIYQLTSLNDKLSKQKEREKQNLIDNLESKTTDARLVTVELQNCGITNWHGDAGKNHLNHIQSETYQSQLDNERSEFVKEFFGQNEEILEVLEANGIITENMMLPNQDTTDDSGYSQNDQDREDEGDDGGDHDGDYKEN